MYIPRNPPLVLHILTSWRTAHSFYLNKCDILIYRLQRKAECKQAPFILKTHGCNVCSHTHIEREGDCLPHMETKCIIHYTLHGRNTRSVIHICYTGERTAAMPPPCNSHSRTQVRDFSDRIDLMLLCGRINRIFSNLRYRSLGLNESG